MKNIFLLLTILGLPNFLSAQAEKKDKRLKLIINNGVSITNYFNKGLYEGEIFSFDTPSYGRKHLKNKVAYFFDANLTYAVGSKQHIGVGYSNYKMAYLIEFDFTNGGFAETGIVKRARENKFSSYYLTHLWQVNIQEKTTLYWNNSVGVDYQSYINSLNKWNPFYRTGLLLEQSVFNKLIFTFQPFVQTALKPYSPKGFNEDYQLTPITFGGSIGLKLHLMEFY